MTVAGHDTAIPACRQTLTAMQQQIQSAVPGSRVADKSVHRPAAAALDERQPRLDAVPAEV